MCRACLRALKGLAVAKRGDRLKAGTFRRGGGVVERGSGTGVLGERILSTSA